MGAAGASGQRIARALAARGVPLTLAGRARDTLPGPAARVRVAGAPSAPEGPVSPGIQATAAQAAAEGTAWYADGALTRAPLGTGGTLMTLGGHAWPMIPAATAELETAHRASGA